MVTPITSADTQIYAIKKSKNVRVKLNVAKTTEDEQVMKEILSTGSNREIVALASNPNLTEDIEIGIIDKNIPTATNALISRTDGK